MSAGFRHFRAFLFLPVFLLCAETATAQFRAGIQGTVTDSTGGAIPGVSVVVASNETAVSRETVTNDSGFYRVDGLAPGTYKVTVTLSGFKERVVTDVRVTAEEVRGLDVTLDPGDIAETVTVVGGTQTLSTENAEIGGTLTTVEIQRLPQVGRDPYELIRLTPGVFGLGARDGSGNASEFPNQAGPGGSDSSVFQTENQVPISANGQRVEGNNFSLDGVTAMSQAWGGAAVVTPNQESVKEIRVISSPYSAEFGRNTGAQVQVVSQNGTNLFHGSAVFKRNTPGLNSKNPFGGVNLAPQRVNQLLSQYAGSIGGPIRTDKLFFFFSYEGLRRKATRAGVEWVETPELINAIRTQRPNSIAAQVLAFPGMTSPRITRVIEARDVGSLTGAPGQVVTAGVGGGLDGIPDVQQVQLEQFENVTSQQFNTRIDYAVTQADLIAFSTYFVPVDRDFNETSPWGNTTREAGDFTSSRRNMVGTLLWTRTISPTMINEARFNVTRWYFDEVASNPEMAWGIPRIFINQPVPNDVLVTYGPNVGPGVFYQTTYNVRNTLTKVMNSHALKFGGDIIREQNNDKAPWAGRPRYSFNNFWSFANDAPIGEEAFFDPTDGSFTDLAAYARGSYYALFVQDDWKFRPNLTLNLGMRWEYFAPLQSKNDQISNLILGANDGLVDARLQAGGDLHEPDRNNFAPQVGFAWTPGRFNQRLVVRGGFGVGYNRLPGSRVLEARFNPPFFAGFNLGPEQIVYGMSPDPQTFNYPNNPSTILNFDPTSGLPTTGAAVNVNATRQELPNPYVYRYSMESEYDLGSSWVVTLGYQGSTGRNLARVIPYHRFVTPNPRLGSVNLLQTDTESNYNALLTGVSRRFASGFLVSADYRWSKSEDTCSSDHDCKATYPFDQELERGPSDYDVTHSVRVFGTWDLPFLRDRKDLVGALAGGWQVSGIVTASSGYPWTPKVGGALCNVTIPTGSICPLRPVAYNGGASEDTSDEVFLRQFGQFTGGPLQYFTLPPAGSFTDPPRPGIGRNSFRGPNYFSVDMNIGKRFRLPRITGLGDDAGLEIRASSFNVFNNRNFKPFIFDDRNTNIQDPDFGRALEGLAGRVVEFQARFSF
jgi:hypothetical protein